MVEEKYPSRYAMVNGLRYHYKVAGPAEGKLVLHLHGFPELESEQKLNVCNLNRFKFSGILNSLRQ